MRRRSPVRYFKTLPEIIRPAVMSFVRLPLSLRNVEDLLQECGLKVSRETISFQRQRFGSVFAAAIWRKRARMRRSLSRWPVDEVFVTYNRVQHYLWRVVDYEGECSKQLSKHRDKRAALTFLRKLMKRYGRPEGPGTDELGSDGAVLEESYAEDRQVTGRWPNNTTEDSHRPFRRRERAMLRFRRMRSL